jgi:Zn-dependent peptidase ImmA (M78 family)
VKDVSIALGLPESALDSAIAPIPTSDGLFDALVATDQLHGPTFVIENRSEEAKKFALCRGLFEYLNSTNGDAHLITKARSECQKRNRAFAAEFLVPAFILRERVRDSITAEEVDELAEEFRVSTSVVWYQLKNHNLVYLTVTE